MRIEIISCRETAVHMLPEQVEFVGLTLEDTKRLLNINAGFPGAVSLQCTNRKYRLAEGLILTLHQYTLGGKASVLSWKPYPNFLFYELTVADISVKVYG